MVDEEDWTILYKELEDEAYKVRYEKHEKYGQC
jgi:hypothetical protein